MAARDIRPAQHTLPYADKGFARERAPLTGFMDGVAEPEAVVADAGAGGASTGGSCTRHQQRNGGNIAMGTRHQQRKRERRMRACNRSIGGRTHQCEPMSTLCLLIVAVVHRRGRTTWQRLTRYNRST